MDVQAGQPKFYGAQFNELAEIVGVYAAHLICERFGGRENIYIPIRPDREHVLRHVLGDAKFGRLVKELGGLKINIPKAPGPMPKKALVMDAIFKGELSNAQIVERCGVSGRYVRRIRADLRAEEVALPPTSVLRGPSKKPRIIEALRDGNEDHGEIADRIGVSVSWVKRVQHELDARQPERTDR